MIERPKQRHTVKIFSLFLLTCGVFGVMAYWLVTPKIIGDHVALDGSMNPAKVVLLDNMRIVSLIIGLVFLFLGKGLFWTAYSRSNHFWVLRIQNIILSLNTFNIEKFLSQFWQNIPKIDKKLFLANLTLALLCHGFLLSNIIINWDGQGGLYFISLNHIETGRWTATWLGFLTEWTLMPFPFMAFSIVALAVSGVMIARHFHYSSLLQGFGIASFLISFPSYAIAFSYNWICYGYPLATLLVLLSIQQVAKKGLYSWLKGLIWFIIALGIYQGYLAFGFSLMVVSILLKIAQGTKPTVFIWRCILLMLIAPFAYKILTDVILVLMDMSYSGYKNADQITSSFILSNMYDNIMLTYKAFMDFWSGLYFSMPVYTLLPLIIMMALGLVILILEILKKGQSGWHKVLAFILIILCPIFTFATRLLNTEITSLLIYGLIPIFAGLFYLISQKFNGIVRSSSYVLIAMILLGFVNRNNKIHLRNHLMTQFSLELAADIALRISALPEYNANMPVARIGNLSSKKFPPYTSPPFTEEGAIMSAPTGFATYGEARTMSGIIHYLGLHYNPIDILQLPKRVIDKVAEIPIYPEEGSVQAIDGYVIVNLSR